MFEHPEYTPAYPPARASWHEIEAALLAHVEALRPERVLELHLAVTDREVATVTIHRSADDVITASGPLGPFETPGRTSFTWQAQNHRYDPPRSHRIARSVIDFVKSLDGIPNDDERWSDKGTVQFRVMTSSNSSATLDSRWHDYADHRTGAQIDRLLHYGHIIPVGRGLTQAYIDEHYPGWTWNSLTAVLQAADVHIAQGGSPPRCRPTVKAIHFTDAQTWAVEWLDGSVTRSE